MRDFPQAQKRNSYKLNQVDGRIVAEYGRYWLRPVSGLSNFQRLFLIPVSSPIFEGGGR